MSTFLIRSATSQSSSYPTVLTRLGGPRSRPNPHLKFVEVPGIMLTTRPTRRSKIENYVFQLAEETRFAWGSWEEYDNSVSIPMKGRWQRAKATAVTVIDNLGGTVSAERLLFMDVTKLSCPFNVTPTVSQDALLLPMIAVFITLPTSQTTRYFHKPCRNIGTRRFNAAFTRTLQ